MQTAAMNAAESNVRVHGDVYAQPPAPVQRAPATTSGTERSRLADVGPHSLNERFDVIHLAELLDEPADTSQDRTILARGDTRELGAAKLPDLTQDRGHVAETAREAGLRDEIDDGRPSC